MRRLSFQAAIAAAMIGLAGCAADAGSAALGRDAQVSAAGEPPLGSRIRKKSGVAPLAGATREDVEQARVQAGAAQVGEFNRTGN